MPYVNSVARRPYDVAIEELITTLNEDGRVHPGHLVYVLYQIVGRLVALNPSVNFEYLNMIMGALENTKLEFSKRVIGPYEDSKLQDEWISNAG